MAVQEGSTVIRRIQICTTHGRGEFESTLSGPGAHLTFRCIECRNETMRRYRKEIDDGLRTVKPRKPEPKLNLCEDCNSVLPATKVCDFC